MFENVLTKRTPAPDYQADTLSKRRRKGIEDVDGQVQPPRLRLFKLLDLVLKDGQNGRRRVAAVQSGGKLAREKVFFGLFLICSEEAWKMDWKLNPESTWRY